MHVTNKEKKNFHSANFLFSKFFCVYLLCFFFIFKIIKKNLKIPLLRFIKIIIEAPDSKKVKAVFVQSIAFLFFFYFFLNVQITIQTWFIQLFNIHECLLLYKMLQLNEMQTRSNGNQNPKEFKKKIKQF